MQKKFDPKVFQLGYVALETADLERTKDHYLETLGMTETAKGDDGSVYLSIGHSHHDLVLRPAKQKSLLHLGFQLKPHIAVADFAREVRDYGLTATIKTDSQPGVAELVEVEVPGGNVFQFYSAIEAPTPGFKETGVSLLRLGHVAVISTEAPKLMEFYQDFLGFWYTDDIAGIANFFTCNRDHHVVNIVNAPESRVHHIAFELRGTAHHVAAADTLRRAGCNQLWGPVAAHGRAQHRRLSLRPEPGDGRALHRDGRLHPGTRDPGAPPLARAQADEAAELAVPRAERLGRRVQLQPRRRLTAPRPASTEQLHAARPVAVRRQSSPCCEDIVHETRTLFLRSSRPPSGLLDRRARACAGGPRARRAAGHARRHRRLGPRRGRRSTRAVPAAAVCRSTQVTLRAPIPRPGKILAIGLNYADHIEELKEAGHRDPDRAGLVLQACRPRSTIRTATSSCRRSRAMLDYEVELVAVIGKKRTPHQPRRGAGPCLRLCRRQRRHRAGLAAPDAAMDAGQVLRHPLPVRAGDRDRRRGRRPARARHPLLRQRRAAPELEHPAPRLRPLGPDRRAVAGDDARAGRPDLHRHARRHRFRLQAVPSRSRSATSSAARSTASARSRTASSPKPDVHRGRPPAARIATHSLARHHHGEQSHHHLRDHRRRRTPRRCRPTCRSRRIRSRRRSIAAAEAGAAIIHLHARDPETGRPDPSPANGSWSSCRASSSRPTPSSTSPPAAARA